MSEKFTISDIRTIDLFADLDDAALSAILPLAVRKVFEARETVFAAGDDANEVYFLISGAMRTSVVSPQGREVIFHDIAPGQEFGELGSLDHGPRAVSVHALEGSVVAVLGAKQFREVLMTHPSIAMRQISKLAISLRVVSQRVYEQSVMLTTERVKSELIRLSRPSDIDGEHVINPLPSQAEIAARIGSHREAVSRIMVRLDQAGLIKRQGDILVIKDIEALISTIGAT